MNELKRCNHCGRDLPRSQFYKDKKMSDGLTVCCKQYYAAYYAANRERQRATSWAASVKRRYGLTVEEYEAIIARGCGICGERAKTKIVMDHCHARGKVREALCNNCNIMLGAAGDDEGTLIAGAAYLARHSIT